MSKMIAIQVAEATGAALEWAVAAALGKKPEMRGATPVCESSVLVGKWPVPLYSSSWSETGPFIGRYQIEIDHLPQIGGALVRAKSDCLKGVGFYNEAVNVNVLVAVCRVVSLCHLGETIEVPEELTFMGVQS